MKRGRDEVESNSNSEMKAMVFSDTAVVHGLAAVKSRRPARIRVASGAGPTCS